MSKWPAECEVFIVWPRSLYDRMKAGRDRRNQAVLSFEKPEVDLRRARIYTVLDDESCKGLISCLGVGISLLGHRDLTEAIPEDERHLQISRLRYGKIILVMEDSERGNSVRKQVIATLYRFLWPVLREGHVYLPGATASARISDADLLAGFLDPATRSLSPVLLKNNMSQTLKQAAQTKR